MLVSVGGWDGEDNYKCLEMAGANSTCGGMVRNEGGGMGRGLIMKS